MSNRSVAAKPLQVRAPLVLATLRHLKKSLPDNNACIYDTVSDRLVAELKAEDSMLTNPSATQDDNAQDQHSIQVFDIEKISQRLEKLDRSEKSQRTILNKFDLEHDNGRRALPALSDAFFDGVAALKDKYPNCQVFLEFIAHFAHLSRIRKTSQHMRFPPVLLLGQPGLGRTAVVREIAELLNVSFKILDLSSTTAGFVIAGLSSSWSEAKTGNIVDLLRDGKTANPIVVLDEIDKTSRFAKFDPLGPLYTLLEADAARHFVDEAPGYAL